MAQLEAFTRGATVNGSLPEGLVTISDFGWIGTVAIEDIPKRRYHRQLDPQIAETLLRRVVLWPTELSAPPRELHAEAPAWNMGRSKEEVTL